MPAMHEQIGQDRTVVKFSGAEPGAGPLTWGQKAILRDMGDYSTQFSMGGMTHLAPGSTIEDAGARLTELMRRHAALRSRLSSDSSGHPGQEVAESGQVDLDILTIPEGVDGADIGRFLDELMATWPLTPFDFQRDWPMRMAVVRQGGTCLHVVWALSHLATDGGSHQLIVADMMPGGMVSPSLSDPPRMQILDIAASEHEPQLRQLSARTMRFWESQLSKIPALTFGEPVTPPSQAGERYQRARFSSAAAHLAMQAIAIRTQTDAARVAVALIATAIGRATGVHPLTIKVTVNNRFRPGLAKVIAPIAQNSVVTVNVTDASVDEVVARTRSASMTAGMRAYYDPDDLSELMERLDAERGYAGRPSFRINDQRAMVMRAPQVADASDLTPARVSQKLEQTALTWLGPMDDMGLYDQAMVLIENRRDVLSLHLMWDSWSLSSQQVEALLRGVEEVAVEAAFDPTAPTRVS